jgi:aminopeptidase-like protein
MEWRRALSAWLQCIGRPLRAELSAYTAYMLEAQLTAGTELGDEMHALARRLFPICRSLTGDGVRQTLAILKERLPDLRLDEVPSGTQVFDWEVPPEWNIRDAYVIDPDGRKIIDFKASNLHVVGYSEPVDKVIPLSELQRHLHSLPMQPDAVPYITSYYERRWGFCISHRQRESLKPGNYQVVIDSTLAPGALTYADLVLPGSSEKEVLISTYVCHPSLGNNELSGPIVTAFLAEWVSKLQRRRLTYRFVFVPETIGSILYISRHLITLKSSVVSGFNVSCVGDDRCHSYLPSRSGESWSDRVAQHVLAHISPLYKRYSFLDRGSDERQYCAPGVDLPIASVMRSKYGTYPEYHTSLDDLSFITPTGLQGGFTALRRCIEVLELDRRFETCVLCEPQMGRRGLYSSLGTAQVNDAVRTRMNILAYSDGKHSVLDIAEILRRPAWELAPYVSELVDHGLISSVDPF